MRHCESAASEVEWTTKGAYQLMEGFPSQSNGATRFTYNRWRYDLVVGSDADAGSDPAAGAPLLPPPRST